MSNNKPHLVVFSGAGISAESGMDTYRDEKGLWRDKSLMELMSVGGYYEQPEKVLEVLNDMRLKCYESLPNNAHTRLADLEDLFKVTIITQNVDDLHERAGSTNILHLHGELSKVTSSKNRIDKTCIKEFPMNVPIKIGDAANDGSQLRPAVVLFGEYLTEYNKAIDIVKSANIFLVIGTSLKVFPASQLVKHVSNNIPRYIIDTQELLFDGFKTIQAKATTGIEIFVNEINHYRNDV